MSEHLARIKKTLKANFLKQSFDGDCWDIPHSN
jgi:hypothetical protein